MTGAGSIGPSLTIAIPVYERTQGLDKAIESAANQTVPGVTIDIEHLDAGRGTKDRTTFWVDASQLAGSGPARIQHVLENVAWQTGDTYAVSVRSPIPDAERADYREFGVSAR